MIRKTVKSMAPCGDFMLVVQWPAQEKQGAIYLDPNSVAPPAIGDVHATGPDVTQCKPGDSVMFNAFAGNEVFIGDVRYLLMPASTIIGVCEVDAVEVEDAAPAPVEVERPRLVHV